MSGLPESAHGRDRPLLLGAPPALAGAGLGALIVLVLIADALDRLLQPSFPLGPIAVAIPGAVVQLGLVWAVFKVLLWLQDRRVLPAQVLHFHLAVGFLALYGMTVLGAHAQRVAASAAITWTALLAWAVAATALLVSSRRIRSTVARDTFRGSSSSASLEARVSASISSTSWTTAGAASVAWTSWAAPTLRSGR